MENIFFLYFSSLNDSTMPNKTIIMALTETIIVNQTKSKVNIKEK